MLGLYTHDSEVAISLVAFSPTGDIIFVTTYNVPSTCGHITVTIGITQIFLDKAAPL